MTGGKVLENRLGASVLFQQCPLKAEEEIL
jgi:hypothetical protein